MAASSEPDYSSSSQEVKVHQFSHDPDKAYMSMKWYHLKQLPIPKPDCAIKPDKVRIVCISDTHCKTKDLSLPPGDILLHAGDFTARGRIEEVAAFAKFMEKQPHKHKVVIAGNHELSFGSCDGYCDPVTFKRLLGQRGARQITDKMKELNISHPSELLSGCIYLNNSSATVCGLKIWGSPWTPYFHGWAYNARRGKEILGIWDLMPGDTDIAMTHGPPVGIGDQTVYYQRAGCVELYSTITERVKPKLHLFGHIHEDHGLVTDGTTLFANASICNVSYQSRNSPICIDLDLPSGYTKDDVTVEPISSERVVSRVFPRLSGETANIPVRLSELGEGQSEDRNADVASDMSEVFAAIKGRLTFQ